MFRTITIMVRRLTSRSRAHIETLDDHRTENMLA